MKKNNLNKWKKFKYFALIWLIIFSIGLVNKTLQNDTFYTIKIGKLIFNNGIDMMDHFSFHEGMMYTYPHWLYDCFIYLIYSISGFTGIYISSIILFIILILCVYKASYKVCENYLVSSFSTLVCILAIGSFVTARAQLVSFILFALEIYFIESFLKNEKKYNLLALLFISLIICNVHVAVWPFYFIIYLPYLAEYIIALVCSKIKFKKENKFINYLKNRFIVDKNNNIKYLFLIMILSLGTGLLTPIGNTPYTYMIKTMMGNSQKYIQEHQMLTWASSPFTIVMAFEIIFLAFFSKVKLRDIFMCLGLVIMTISSIRHMSLLALVGSICFARTFALFLENFDFDVNEKIINILYKKKIIIYGLFGFVLIFTTLMLNMQSKKEYVDHKLYPVEAVKYIKENMDYKNMRMFNEYNYGSYLLLNDIPVFIDSRADLYTKEFSGFDYDVFDDFQNIMGSYQDKFEFYNISHVILRKEDNNFMNVLNSDKNYKMLYEDDYFIIYEKIGTPSIILRVEN